MCCFYSNDLTSEDIASVNLNSIAVILPGIMRRQYLLLAQTAPAQVSVSGLACNIEEKTHEFLDFLRLNSVYWFTFVSRVRVG